MTSRKSLFPLCSSQPAAKPTSYQRLAEQPNAALENWRSVTAEVHADLAVRSWLKTGPSLRHGVRQPWKHVASSMPRPINSGNIESPAWMTPLQA